MTSISSSDALLIFSKWREGSAQLQITFRRGDRMGGSPARILETSLGNENISAEIISNGESKKWTFSLLGTSSQYGEPATPPLFQNSQNERGPRTLPWNFRTELSHSLLNASRNQFTTTKFTPRCVGKIDRAMQLQRCREEKGRRHLIVM
jgi:hypothetical protein